MTTQAAVILVAGVGARLRPLTDDRPKALMDLGGETILGRALRLLLAAGVGEFVLATGYREDQIQRAVRGVAARITLCPNPDYAHTQNSVSLRLCEAAVRGKSFFKLDGDVVFQPGVLDRLEARDAELAVAVDSARNLDEEAMKVRVEAGQIVEFGKAVTLAQAHAETIGIERLDVNASERVFAALDRVIGGGRTDLYYEDVYSELVRARSLTAAAVEVGDLPWSEVDTLADLESARRCAL